MFSSDFLVRTQLGGGTLQVVPMLKEATAHVLLRPFLEVMSQLQIHV
jgi:hypothetical protein